MARSLRYEAAGAVYHVMARGDGGKNVFDDDKDRFAWTDLMEKAHGRFGWRVHAWVLMGNHLLRGQSQITDIDDDFQDW